MPKAKQAKWVPVEPPPNLNHGAAIFAVHENGNMSWFSDVIWKNLGKDKRGWVETDPKTGKPANSKPTTAAKKSTGKQTANAKQVEKDNANRLKYQEHMDAAGAAEKAGNLAEARKQLLAANALIPSQALQNRAAMHEAAIGSDNQDQGIAALLAQAVDFEDMGDVEEAKEVYQTILETDPTHAEAKKGVARCSE